LIVEKKKNTGRLGEAERKALVLILWLTDWAKQILSPLVLKGLQLNGQFSNWAELLFRSPGQKASLALGVGTSRRLLCHIKSKIGNPPPGWLLRLLLEPAFRRPRGV
jgi:hypothetical protein